MVIKFLSLIKKKMEKVKEKINNQKKSPTFKEMKAYINSLPLLKIVSHYLTMKRNKKVIYKLINKGIITTTDQLNGS